MPAQSRLRLRLLAGASVVLATALVAGCGGSGGGDDDTTTGQKQAAEKAKESAVSIASNLPDGAQKVGPDRLLNLKATDGTFRTVEVKTLKGVALPGTLNETRTAWTSSRLDQGRNYVVTAVAADADGVAKNYTSKFSTATLTKDEMTYPNVYPTPNSTVGVGMPIMVTFTDPVTDRASFERHMKVTSSAGQTGSWYWIDDKTAHYRPKTYWKPNQKVNVDLDLKNVSAGKGIYGQISRKYSLNISRSFVMKVGISSHQMQVFRDGKLQRTLPTTTGEQPKFSTRTGTKVIVEKNRRRNMNSETVGIANDSPDGYNLEGVEYAMRLTFTGEFIHAAPWSVGSQGRANVSHGCTGLSTSNAGWLYDNTIIGDPVEYTGSSPAHMTLTNGYGDWNLSWADWQKGSALKGGTV